MEVGMLRGAADGDGDGDGDGHGSGYGSGYGYGSGSGDGSGDLVHCNPAPLVVTKDDLRAKNACADQFRIFRKTFPAGCNWPDDALKARDAGLDMNWGRTNLGLLFPI